MSDFQKYQVSPFNNYKASLISASPLKQHTAQVRSPRMLFELIAAVSFGILEGDRIRRTRSPVLKSQMTPLTAN